MSIKTTKSYIKRLKITKNGKILSRHAGQNHFNAKERSQTQSKKGRMRTIHMDSKSKSRFLATSN